MHHFIHKFLAHKTLVLLIAAHTAALGDAYTTSRLVKTPGLEEKNPIVRPFVQTPVLYPVISGDLIIADIEVLRRKHSKALDIYLTGAVVEHSLCAIHNANLK